MVEAAGFTLTSWRLDHSVDTLGWRLEEREGRRMLPDRLAAFGTQGPDAGRLQRGETIEHAGRRVAPDDVSKPRRGQRFAFIMDAAWCDAALGLAADADLVVAEATFLSTDADLTAADAARVARGAGRGASCSRTCLSATPEDAAFHEETAAIFPDVVVGRDLNRVAVAARR
ncbi:MAG: hypothetical protein M3O70_27725 [Actinomycetota bacterium]|nr:hypothetical protein [Actinomycetota bacterium]